MARSASGLVMSMGTVSMWGFSPAIDVCDRLYASAASAAPDDRASEPPTTPVSVLLVNPSDIRHALAAVARRRRWDPELRRRRELHIYMLESSTEVLARHLLLWNVARDWSLPLRQRCSLFLEIFGNALVQERTSAYIEEQARALADFVHNERGPLAGFIDLSHLKMRSRDDLIDAFSGWFQRVKFDVANLRDHRLRHYYEERFDYRNNLIDWDYTMNLKKIENASVIHIRQYRDWRNTGIAFEFGDQTYTEPNRTMASYTQANKRNHGSVLCRGLWTDIIVGPYVSLGVACDASNAFAEQLFEVHNKGTGVEQNRHNTTEVAVYNLLSYLHEIETGEVYKMAKEHDIYSGIHSDAAAESDDQQSDTPRFVELSSDKDDLAEPTDNQSDDPSAGDETHRRERIIAESFDGVKVIPLAGSVHDLYTKKRYAHLFDAVFLSAQQAHALQPATEVQEDARTITSILTDAATIDVESSMFMLPLNDEQRIQFVQKLLEWAPSFHCTASTHFSSKDGPSKEDMTQIRNATLRFQQCTESVYQNLKEQSSSSDASTVA